MHNILIYSHSVTANNLKQTAKKVESSSGLIIFQLILWCRIVCATFSDSDLFFIQFTLVDMLARATFSDRMLENKRPSSNKQLQKYGCPYGNVLSHP